MNMPPMPDIRPECKKRRQVEKVLQDTFQDQQQRIRNMRKESGHALELQVFGAYQSRRSEAIVAYIDEIRRRFLADYPDLRMEQDYIRAEILSIDDYDMCEDRSKFSTAAALWVLDELKREDKLDEAYKLLPDEDEAADAHSADIYDSIHPQVTINAMTYAIQYRNEGLQNEDDICYIVDEGTARKRKIESNFRKIIALLDPQIVSDVTKRFEEDMWRWLGLFFEANIPYARRTTEALKELNKLVNQPKPDTKNVMQMVQMDPLSFLSSSPSGPASIFQSLPYESPMQKLEQMFAHLEELDREQRLFFMSVLSPFDTRDMVDQSVLKDMSAFRVQDPLATCFAVIWLLDSGSNLPFLYLPGVAVIESACKDLPWAGDCYKRFVGDKVEKHITINEAGLLEDWAVKARKIYDATGCIIPRNRGMYDWGDRRVGKKLSPAAAVLLDIRNLEKYQTRYEDAQFEVEFGSGDDEEEPDISVPKAEQEASPPSSEEVRKLQDEIERLKRQLYEANHEAQAERHEREVSDAAHESERQQLIDLRDYVFSLEQEEQPVAEDQPQIEFPYQISKRILVFGGHDSWLKAIRPMLDGVRWIDKDDRVVPDAIKNADAIFLQTNAMSHKMFYSVEDCCKKYKKRMRYCCSASAERCARQIVEEDLRKD